jgi:hypothetical protein
VRDERRILDVLGRGLLKEFPNPDRTGCPGSEVLKKIASHQMPLTETEKWLDHLTSCSPCYRDFTQFQAAYQRRRTQTLLAIAASILVGAGVAGWALFLRQNGPLVTQTAVFDLRNYSIPRGTEANPAEPPLEITRNVSQLEIYLPMGSSEGPYDVRIVAQSGETLVALRATCKLEGGISLIRTAVILSSLRPGRYNLQIGRLGSEWNTYALVLR